MAALVLLLGLFSAACGSNDREQEKRAATNTPPVEELGKADCEAGDFAWTESGCRTQADADEIDRHDATAARERKRLEGRGWEILGPNDIAVEGIYSKGFTEEQYERIQSDPRCVNNPNCVAFMVRTDSLTSCPDRLLLEGNVLVGNTIMASTQGRIRALPAGSVARVVLPIRGEIGEYEFGEGRFVLTKVDCQ